MEEENNMSFFKKLKTSIFGLEEYQKLAVQKIGKTIIYLLIIMLVFSFLVSATTTYIFHNVAKDFVKYIDENVETLSFENGNLQIKGKNGNIVVEDQNSYYQKIIVDTDELSQEKIDEYKKDIESYGSAILILKDKIFMKTNIVADSVELPLKDFTSQINLVKLEKQDIINFFSSTEIYLLYAVFLISMWIVMFINYFASLLLDIILYSLMAYLVGAFIGLRFKYIAAYNISAYSLTLPTILNLIYTIFNLLTGYTIKYFNIMYVAITCIYIVAAILIIRSNIIKQQIELSKIIEEQEKVKQELERKKQEEEEEAERERVRKKDEKKRQEEKQKEKNKKEKGQGEGGPEPQANIKMS